MHGLTQALSGEVPKGDVLAGLDALDGVIRWPRGEGGGYAGVRIKGDGLQAHWGGRLRRVGFLGGIPIGLLVSTPARVLGGGLALCWVRSIAVIWVDASQASLSPALL